MNSHPEDSITDILASAQSSLFSYKADEHDYLRESDSNCSVLRKMLCYLHKKHELNGWLLFTIHRTKDIMKNIMKYCWAIIVDLFLFHAFVFMCFYIEQYKLSQTFVLLYIKPGRSWI